ncbi:MAG: [FeFe] hydrogenase H-cluster radical SAM maturase HydE [Clostridiales bacterium]|nr:[FeFe] hydrogenase H-cluster radical SAM maturase HydE [Clostridiales bacterium]
MEFNINNAISELRGTHSLDDSSLKNLITSEDTSPLHEAADIERKRVYGDAVYIRGLIEFTNHCKNNCFYCGIRAGNASLSRYRLTHEEIMDCCREGYALGFRTFVLQGGEDGYYTDKALCDIVYDIKSLYSDCAVTLSVGERSRESYKKLFDAGADRYLLRHETADPKHYAKLHPNSMSLENRKRCLWDLKEIGYQVGSGFMVGSPYQTLDNLISDLRFLQELLPDMIGIGPFLPHSDTPFGDFEKGSLKMCLNLISILRLMFPYALIPATTALGTIHPSGREMGLKAGANVVMPNLSPVKFRTLYELYDNKICTGDESAQCRSCLEMRVSSAGYKLVTDIGNVRRDELEK